MKKLRALLSVCLICLCLTPYMTVISRADAIIDWYENDQWSVDYDIEVTDPDGYVNIRSGPGTDYSILTTAPTGTILHVGTEGLASDGATWCKITYNGYTGWLALSRATVVENTPTPRPTATPAPAREEAADTPTAAPTETAAVTPTAAPEAAPEAADDPKQDTASDTGSAKDSAEKTGSVSSQNAPSLRSSIILAIFILLVLLVIVIAVLLIILLRRP